MGVISNYNKIYRHCFTLVKVVQISLLRSEVIIIIFSKSFVLFQVLTWNKGIKAERSSNFSWATYRLEIFYLSATRNHVPHAVSFKCS